MHAHPGEESVAVVTGATRGLGAALAIELHARGYRIAVCATTTPDVPGALCRAVDVADGDAVDAFAAEVVQLLGPIDLWINNAAVIGPIGLVQDVEPAEWQRCIQVNIVGTLNGTRAFLSSCSAGSTLVNIASRAGVEGVAGLAAYSATKAAVIALTQSVAAEGTSSASARVVVPPSVDTDMQRELLAQGEPRFPGVLQSRARRDTGGILHPREAARAILMAVLDDQASPTVIDLSSLRSADPNPQ